MTGPTSVSSSAGSPTSAPRPSARTTARTRRSSDARRRCAARRCSSGPRRRTRLRRASPLHASMSASAATITGVELPSSSFTRLRGARSCSFQPTSLEPVNVISFTRSSSTRTSPICGRGSDDDVEPACGQPGFLLELCEEERRERRLRRRLQDDGAAGGECGRDLVRNEVAREVEGRDRGDDPDRLAEGEAELAFAGLRSIHRHHLAAELARLDCGERVRRHRARGFDARRLDRLARFVGDRARDLFVAPADQPATLTRISARL